MPTDATTDRWDFYACEIEAKPHLTMVNLSLFELAPIQGLNLFHCLEITLKHPDPEHGMPSKEEFQSLSHMEDLIHQCETDCLRYVARQTGGHKRKFYFYASQEIDFISLTNTVEQVFPNYKTATFNFEDVDWQTYFENLYPNAIGMNEISNRSVFLRLEEKGDNLDIAREIDHNAIFKNRNQARAFSKLAEERGFTVEISTSGIFSKTYDLLVQRVDPPSQLDPITYELQELAAELGGSYDGWGCLVQTSSD